MLFNRILPHTTVSQLSQCYFPHHSSSSLLTTHSSGLWPFATVGWPLGENDPNSDLGDSRILDPLFSALPCPVLCIAASLSYCRMMDGIVFSMCTLIYNLFVLSSCMFLSTQSPSNLSSHHRLCVSPSPLLPSSCPGNWIRYSVLLGGEDGDDGSRTD